MANEQIAVLSEEEVMRRIALLNTLEVVASDGDGESLYYVEVEKNPEMRDVLGKLGFSDKEIDSIFDRTPDGFSVDISDIAFSNRVGAKWYDGNMFMHYRPCEMCGEPSDEDREVCISCASKTVKLSALDPDTMLINDNCHIITAGRLAYEITKLGEKYHLDRKWQVAEKLTIGCNTEEMIEDHVEKIVCDAEISEDDELYDLLLGALKSCAPEIQSILDKAIADLDTRYWIGTQQQVEIDVKAEEP